MNSLIRTADAFAICFVTSCLIHCNAIVVDDESRDLREWGPLSLTSLQVDTLRKHTGRHGGPQLPRSGLNEPENDLGGRGSKDPEHNGVLGVTPVHNAIDARSDFSKARPAKKALGILTRGNPNVFYRLSPHGPKFYDAEMRGNFGLSKVIYDRPRPLRWG